MIRFLVIITAFFLSSNLDAQKTEYNAGISTGFLHFSGPSAEKYSFINESSLDPSHNYTNDQYGKFSKPGPGAFLSFRHIAKSNWLWGIYLRTELLKNKVKLQNLFTSNSNKFYKGSTVFTSKSVSIALNTGYRLRINRAVTIDLSPDLEFCFFVDTNHEKGFARYTSSNQTITTDRDRDRPKFDIRTGLQADAKWRDFILSISYSIGHWNYYEGYVGGSWEAYSRLLRIGLGYCLNKKKN